MSRLNYCKPKAFKPESLAIIDQANAICAEYEADGYDLTLRQLYYQFVARGLIANKQSEYKRLGSLVNDARLCGLMDWDYIVDRTRSLSDLAHWTTPAELVDAAARQFRLAKWDQQPTRVEVWIEKEALAGVVERVCQRLDVPFFACRGYVSQSELWAAGQRVGKALENGQRVVVLHLGDHDPSGIDMTRDNRDRLSTFVEWDHARAYITEHGKPTDAQERSAFSASVLEVLGRLEVRRIALNMDQVDEYDPPPNPAKLTDSRVGGYLEAHGDESWELDALPPDVLATLIEEHVLAERDDDLWDEVVEVEDRGRAVLDAIAERWDEVAELVGEGDAA